MSEKGKQMEKDKSNMDGRNPPVKTQETENSQIQANRGDAERVIPPVSLPISGVEGEPGESSSESSGSISRAGDSSNPPESSDIGAGSSSSPTESSQSTSGAGDSLSPDESSESTSGVVASSSSVGSTDATSGVDPSRSVSADATSGMGASLSSAASTDANSAEDSLSSVESADPTPTDTPIVSAGDSDSVTSLDARTREELTIITDIRNDSEEISESNESTIGTMPLSETSAIPTDDSPLLRKMLSLDTSQSSSKSPGVSSLAASCPRLVGMLTSGRPTEPEDQNPIPSDLMEQMQQQMQQDMISPQDGNRSLGLGSRTRSTTSDYFGACSAAKNRRTSEESDQIVPVGDTKPYTPAPYSFASCESSSDNSISESVGLSPLLPPDSGVDSQEGSSIVQGSEGSSVVQGSEGSSVVQGSEGSSVVQGSEGNNFESEQDATCSTDRMAQAKRRMCGESEEGESSDGDSGLPRSPKKKLTTEPPLARPHSRVDSQEGSSGVQGTERNNESEAEATSDVDIEVSASPAEKLTTKTPNPPEPEDKN